MLSYDYNNEEKKWQEDKGLVKQIKAKKTKNKQNKQNKTKTKQKIIMVADLVCSFLHFFSFTRLSCHDCDHLTFFMPLAVL